MKPRRTRRRRWPFAVGGTLVLLAIGSFALRARSRPEPIDESRIIVAEKHELAVDVLEVGRIEPERQVDLKSKIPGVVAEVKVEEGDHVRAGDLLLSLDVVDAHREVARTGAEAARSKNALAFAQQKLARAKQAQAAGILSRADLESAQNEAQEKRWSLAASGVQAATARDRERYTRLVSPIDGTVIHREIDPGETVTPGVEATVDGKPLLTIADLSRLLVKVDLNQIDVAKVRVDQAVTLHLDALSDRDYHAKVTRIAPASIRRPGKDVDVFPVEAVIVDADGRIKPGMTAETRIHVEKRPETLALPIEAVRKDAGKNRVTRVLAGKNGPKREEIEVRLGARNDREVEVASGVEPGDRILLEPASASANETKM